MVSHFHRCLRHLGALIVAGVVALASFGVVLVGPSGTAQAATNCPALMVYGIQGTGQSAKDASPDLDTGFLSSVLGPLNDGKSEGRIKHKYVPYDAGFGGAVPGGSAPYSQSVTGAVNTATTWVKQFTQSCPLAKVAFVGYSQGAHAVRVLVNKILQGVGIRLSADRIAAVANFGDPTRPKGAPLFPGAPGQTTPSPVPGTAGQMVSKVVATAVQTAEGGGIGPSRDTDADLSAIAGRYASFCTPGDLACDAPSDAPIAQLVTNIAGQSTLNKDDPVASLATIGNALAMTTVKTAIPVINEDFSAADNNLESLSYQPQQTMSSRLAEASDPRSPMPTIDEGLSALWKVGTIAFNAVKTVVQEVATPETIGQVVLAGAANPAAIIGILAPKLAQAAVTLVPPATGERWVSEAFTAFESEFADNADLFSVTSALKLFNTAAKHGSYGTVAATPTGAPPTTFVTQWLKAAATDIAEDRSGSSPSVAATTNPTTGAPSFVLPPSSSTTPTTTADATTSTAKPEATETIVDTETATPSTDVTLPTSTETTAPGTTPPD